MDAAAPGPSRTAWGYVLLALAAACIGFDRFSDDVAAQMQQETAEWVLEFQSNLLRLERERSNGTATRPGRYHCRVPPSLEETPTHMPTDHGPELEALRKRLGDAKEFL